MTLPKPIRVAVRELARNHRSGSVSLALQACRILETFRHRAPGPGKQSAPDAGACAQVARWVAGAQPSMAAVLNVCNRWLGAVERGEPTGLAARHIARQLRQAQKTAAVRAAGLIPHEAVLVTYSFSSTVLAALLEARKQGRPFRVLCSESRPLYEGRTLAAQLARRKISVELFTDAALLSAVSKANLVLAGCDAMESGSFINKVGTAALAGLARDSRVPFYLVADSFKLLPAKLARWFRIREESGTEVWQKPAKGVSIHNAYFEPVPLRLCSAVVLETGVCSPKEIRKMLQEAEVVGAFQRLLPNRRFV